MKLVDFSENLPLNLLRFEMGNAPLLNVFNKSVVPEKPPRIVTPIQKIEASLIGQPSKVLSKTMIQPLRVPTPVPFDAPVFKVPPRSVPIPSAGVFEVNYGDIQVGSDRTLRYLGQKAIFYIRDVSSYQGSYSLPKFHIADCITRQGMRTKNLNDRFIAATRGDGLFPVRIDGHSKDVRLAVCQHCLEDLHWHGFTRKFTAAARQSRVVDFSLQQYLNT